MTKRETEIIKANLKAFENNFGKCRIEKEDYGKGFYLFYPEDADTWIQYCENINYLDGFLYGCVMGFLRREFKDGAKKMETEHKGIYAYREEE